MSTGTFDNTTAMRAAMGAYSNRPDERRAATRAVCSMAVDATEAAEVLAMLGLDPTEGKLA